MKRLLTILVLLISSGLLIISSSVEDTLTNILRLEILEMSHSGTISLKMNNLSLDTIKTFKESNSWGASRWRILVLRKNQLKSYIQNPNQIFTRNIPSFFKISPKASAIVKLDLNDGKWCGVRNEGETFEPDDRVIVIYDVPNTAEAKKLNVWNGFIVAFKKL
jgi:hypothetical protein